jgi:hypothetical protein
VSPQSPFIKSSDVKMKPEPVDAGSFLSSPRLPHEKNKNPSRTFATVEISSEEEENVTPTPKKQCVKFKFLTIFFLTV